MMQVYESLPEGTPVQLIEDCLVMEPPPIYGHQRTLCDLFLSLANFIKQHDLGEAIVAPFGVYFDEQNAFQPDIVFISKERLHLLKRKGLFGAPDLAIEVLSPSTSKYDRQQKKSVYERFGVKEYWLIDPETTTVQGYQLIDHVFRPLPLEEGVIRSPLLGASFHF